MHIQGGKLKGESIRDGILNEKTNMKGTKLELGFGFGLGLE